MVTKWSSPEEINRVMYPAIGIHDSLQSADDLGEEEVRTYHNQGFLSIENLLSADEIQTALEAIMDNVYGLCRTAKLQLVVPQSELKTNEEKELATRKLYDFVATEERLRSIANHPQVIAVVERLLGEKPKLIQDMALLKPPRGGGEKPWHQDMAYGPLAYDRPAVGVWIALDQAGLDNGCMQAIPRSHRMGPIPHYAQRDWQLCDDIVPVQTNVSIPLKPGGALFFHGYLMHGTPNNFSDKRRRALQFHYVVESAAKLQAAEYKRLFTNEMTGAEC